MRAHRTGDAPETTASSRPSLGKALRESLRELGDWDGRRRCGGSAIYREASNEGLMGLHLGTMMGMCLRQVVLRGVRWRLRMARRSALQPWTSIYLLVALATLCNTSAAFQVG